MRRMAIIVCFFVFSALTLLCTTGCRSMGITSPEWQRQRQYVIETDMKHLNQDIHYVLGLREPSRLFDETAR